MEFFTRDPFASLEHRRPVNTSTEYDEPISPMSTRNPSFSFYNLPRSNLSRSDSVASLDEDLANGAAVEMRLTAEQSAILERQLSDSTKPSLKVRRQLAEMTGLSAETIATYFNSRRTRAKQSKRQDELRTRKVLEAAGKARGIQISSPTDETSSYPPSIVPEGMKLSIDTSTCKFAQAKMAMNSPSPFGGLETYASPLEASFASLDRARALAQAAAEASDFSGQAQRLPSLSTDSSGNSFSSEAGFSFPAPPHSPFPCSAFSDFGTEYTTSPRGSMVDPFEFDHLMETDEDSGVEFCSNPPSRAGSCWSISMYMEPEQLAEEYSDIIDAYGPSNSISPGSFSSPCSSPRRLDSTANAAAASFARRRKPKPSPLGLRSYSLMSPCRKPGFKGDSVRSVSGHAPPSERTIYLRRTNSIGPLVPMLHQARALAEHSTPRTPMSPLHLEHSVEEDQSTTSIDADPGLSPSSPDALLIPHSPVTPPDSATHHPSTILPPDGLYDKLSVSAGQMSPPLTPQEDHLPVASREHFLSCPRIFLNS